MQNQINLLNKKVNLFVIERSTSMAYKRRRYVAFPACSKFRSHRSLELHFEDGFNLLSGETGAGKSIIVDALGLLAARKPPAEMIRTGENRAVVEADLRNRSAAELERSAWTAKADEVIIRREISPMSRNRVYINNQPSTVSALRELAPSCWISMASTNSKPCWTPPANLR